MSLFGGLWLQHKSGPPFILNVAFEQAKTDFLMSSNLCSNLSDIVLKVLMLRHAPNSSLYLIFLFFVKIKGYSCAPVA